MEKIRVDAARHRQEKGGNETGKIVIAHGSVDFCEATPIGLADETKEFCTGARQTKTCAALRHVDASRELHFIFSERAGCVGEGGRRKLSLLFSFPCLANREQDWPPSKVGFRVGNQYYAECEKQQRQQQDLSNANLTRGHKEVRRSTVYIAVTASYSNQHGFKITTKPLPGPTNREHHELISVKIMSLGMNYSSYLSIWSAASISESELHPSQSHYHQLRSIKIIVIVSILNLP